MKSYLLFCGLLLSAAAVSGQSRTTISSDIIDTYSEMIAANPKSADLYLSRAGEYQTIGRYSQALDDLSTALGLVKNSDKGVKYAILCRRATIRSITGDRDGAIEDLNDAIVLYPEQPSSIATRADLLLKNGDYAGARADYNRIRRMMPRDQQAIFGLAKVEALSGDSDKAMAYANDAVDLYPRKGISYSGRADILKALNRHEDAIDQYIQAIFCDDSSSGDAIQHLVDLSYDDYKAVEDGFSRAILDKPTAGILYYLRGTIAASHNHHLTALEDMEHIDGSGPFAGGALNTAMAESLFALGMYDNALKVLEETPDNRHNASYFLTRANVNQVLGRLDDALTDASSALAIAPSSADAMVAKSRILMAMGRNDDASKLLGEAILTDSTKPLFYMLRGAVSGNNHFYEQALELPYEPDDPNSLRGFSLLKTGKQEQADAWMSSVMRLATDSDGSASYIAACYYAQRGDTEQAFKFMERALERGYSNAYNWISDTTPDINVAPLRTKPRFAEILERHSNIFRKQ